MNRRILFSLPFAALICVSVVQQVRAQEVLPQQAAVSAQSSEQLSIVQWVKPKTTGVLKGDIFAPVLGGAAAVVDDAVVVIRGQDGWVGEAATNRLGRFTVTDVKPGVYSILVKAPGLFAFYAIQVVAENDVDAHAYPERVRVSCAFIDETAVSRMAKHMKGEMTMDDVVVKPEGAAVAQSGNTAASSVVTLRDGKLSGVMSQAGSGFKPAAGVQVTVIKDGLSVGTDMTGEDGKFEIGGLDSGIYGIVASGMSGVAVVGIEARADDEDADDGQANDGTRSKDRFVALLQQQSGGGGELSLQVSPNTMGAPDPSPEQNDNPAVAGTGGAGGGGGGGGGGVAALAAAAAAAAAASSGGDNIILASPAK